MNGTKKLGLLAIVAAIIVSGFKANVTGLGLQENELSINQEILLEVRYFSQKEGTYCGQATTQMVLYAAQGIRVQQRDLEDEMDYIKGKGTVNSNMIKPFKNRDANIISSGILKNQKYLRNSVDKGYYTIINIRFSENSKSGHYVIVTGYNSTGFFVHDPWPERWGRPEGRQTGENAYISAESLQQLWWFRHNWALTVAGPDSIIQSVSPQEVALCK